MIVLAMLCLASALVFGAILRRDQPLLLLGVVAYAGTCLLIMEMAPELLLPALSLAVALAILGLARFLVDDCARDSEEGRLHACFYGDPDERSS